MCNLDALRRWGTAEASKDEVDEVRSRSCLRGPGEAGQPLHLEPVSWRCAKEGGASLSIRRFEWVSRQDS